MMKRRTDRDGRTWEYNDAEGTYSYKNILIGCGGNNGSKWMNWNAGRCAYEYDTLRQAMCSEGHKAERCPVCDDSACETKSLDCGT